MSIKKTEGIILKKIKWSETSNIVTLYSKDFGKLKLLAKGVQRLKSSFSGGLELFGLIDFVFYKRGKKNLYILSSSDLVSSYPLIFSSVERYGVASAGIELLDKLLAGEEKNEDIYSLLVDFLSKVQDLDKKNLEKFLWAYSLKLLSLLGYKPRFDECVKCGKRGKSLKATSSGFLFFSSDLGGIVCPTCAKGDKLYFRLTRSQLNWIRRVLDSSLDRIEKLELEKREVKNIGDLILDFLSYHTGFGKELKSLEFLKKISLGKEES